jgi:hypothetical protein
LGFFKIRGDVDIGDAEKLAQFLEFNKTILKNDMRADIEFAYELLQHDTVCIPMLFQNMRVGCPQDNIGHIGVFVDNRRKRLQYIFDAFIGGKQAECEQHLFAFHAELVFVEAGINKGCIRNAVMDKDDFLFGHRVDLFKKVKCLMAHHDQFVGQLGQLAHDGTIFRRRVFQHRVQRGHHRHAQVTQ